MTEREKAAYLFGFIDGMKRMMHVEAALDVEALDRLGRSFLSRMGLAIGWPSNVVCEEMAHEAEEALIAAGFWEPRPASERN